MSKLIHKTENNNNKIEKEIVQQSAFRFSKSENLTPMSNMDNKQQQISAKNHSFKIDDILSTSSITKLYNKLPDLTTSSLYCSPISSLSSPYSQINQMDENQFNFQQMPLVANAFNASNFYFNTTSDELNSFKNFQSAFLEQLTRQNSFLKTTMISNDSINETNKISMIDELAKQIDTISESSKQSQNQDKKKQKKTKNSDDSPKDSQPKKKKEKSYTCSGNCSDLGCSSMMSSDASDLPMCLRGTSEEQLHLASLFNTLIHHKKCRRTRTVFSDMQLIGLEKRFENQKYLSTPDRIQLAEFLGLSQLQVKTWYQNRRMKWKKKVLKDGSSNAPTKPKGRPKKNSIPSFSEILAAANNSTGSSAESLLSSSMLKNSSLDDDSSSSSDIDVDLSDDDENEEICYDYSDSENESQTD